MWMMRISCSLTSPFPYPLNLTNKHLHIGQERATWPPYKPGINGHKYGNAAIFGSGNNEIAGGSEKGRAVKIEEDTWSRKECEYWDERTELFES
jgi:hypothetical protein